MSNNTRRDVPGYQENVKYCPACKGELRSVASINKSAAESHLYECQSERCKKAFEINEYQ